MRRVHGLIAATAVAALLAGCGSGSSHGARVSPPLTVAAWKQKINEICGATTARSNALPKPLAAAELIPFVQKIVTYGDAEISQIKRVRPPSQLAAGQRQVVFDLTTIFGGLQALLSKHMTPAAFATATRTPAVQHAAQDYVARSKAAGLSSCVLGPGA
jgi:hypothetical protein